MVLVWQLLSDDERERATFASLDHTLAMPFLAAGPKNRLRSVRRLETAHGVYFLKVFTRTQWQNRVTFAWSAPRAKNDADREHKMSSTLRAQGFAAPRPVAYGARGAASFYLCAEVPGTSWRDLLARGVNASLARAVATHCGQLLAAGFWLPDLSADHVFVHGHAAPFALSVLDLHNGRLAAAGCPKHWVLARVLRRCRRSVRDLVLPQPMVLRFAARLLRAAGCGDVRSMLRREAPWATAQRYDAVGKSAAYAERNPRRAVRELELLRSVWPGRTGETVLDLPCGAGRLLPLLATEFAHRVVQADGSLAMAREALARAHKPVPVALGNALAMPFASGAVDGVVMFRFLHHLPRDTAALAIAEACRVARRFVVVSFFHPCSVHHAQRLVRSWFGASPTRFAQSLGALQRQFAPHGYRLVAHTADRAFTKDLWLAAFVRV